MQYAVKLARMTRPQNKDAPDFIQQWVRWGAGPRAGQYLILGAKARALLSGRTHVNQDDIQALVVSVFRHRVLVGYRAEAEGISVENVIDRLLDHVKPAI